MQLIGQRPDCFPGLPPGGPSASHLNVMAGGSGADEPSTTAAGRTTVPCTDRRALLTVKEGQPDSPTIKRLGTAVPAADADDTGGAAISLGKKLVLGFVLSAITLFADTIVAVAQMEQVGKAQRTELEARYDVLFQEILEEPGNLDAMFAFASVATELGEYEAAISTLERMLIFNPDLPRVRLELGALYFRIGSYIVAESWFAQVADVPDAPAAVKERVAEFREEIARRSSNHQFAGQVSLGIRYQSNANGGPAARTVRVLGLTGELNDSATAQEDYNWFVSGAAQHTYDLGTRTGSWLESTGRAYVSRQFDQDEVDLVFLQATTGPRMALSEDGMKASTVRPFAIGSFVHLGDDRLYTEGGGGLDFRFPLGKLFSWTAETQLVYQDHNDAQKNRDGFEFHNQLGLTYQATEQLQVDLISWIQHDAARADFEENNEIAGFASMRVSIDPDLPGILDSWILQPFAGIIQTRYDAPDPAIDPAITRNDVELRYGIVNTFPINETLELQLSFSRTENDSNLPNFEFQNNQVALSTTLNF